MANTLRLVVTCEVAGQEPAFYLWRAAITALGEIIPSRLVVVQTSKSRPRILGDHFTAQQISLALSLEVKVNQLHFAVIVANLYMPYYDSRGRNST